MASRKFQYAQQVQAICTDLAQAIDAAADAYSVYFDRGYNSGGSDPIGDSDVVGLEITAAQLGSFITLAEQLNNFANNSAVTQGDYDATLNILKTVSVDAG